MMVTKSKHGTVSAVLFNDESIPLPKIAATLFGVNEALFIQQLHFFERIGNFNYEGEVWVYKTIEDWSEELPWWSTSTIKRIIKTLTLAGLLQVKQLDRNRNNHTNYYRLNYSVLDEMYWNHVSAKETPAIGSKWSNPLGQNEPIHQVNLNHSNHRIHIEYTETTKQAKNPLACDTQNQNQTTTETTESQSMPQAKDIILAFKQQQKEEPLPLLKSKPIVSNFEKLWNKVVPKYHSSVKFIPVFIPKQQGQMKHILKRLESEQLEVLYLVLKDWINFCHFVNSAIGKNTTIPQVPNLDYLLLYVMHVKNFYIYENPVKKVPPVQLTAPIKQGNSMDNNTEPTKVKETTEEKPWLWEDD